MKLLLILLLAAAIPALAQTTAPITGTCALPNTLVTVNTATGLMTTLGGAPVTLLSLQTLALTGGTSYPDGQYIVSLTGGVSTLIPYTSVSGATYTVSFPTFNGSSWVLVPGITLAAGQQATVWPVSSHTGSPVTADWFYYSQPRIYVDSAGAVYVGINNATSTAIANAKVTVTVK